MQSLQYKDEPKQDFSGIVEELSKRLPELNFAEKGVAFKVAEDLRSSTVQMQAGEINYVLTREQALLLAAALRKAANRIGSFNFGNGKRSK